jgi:hypothetical protein
VLVASALIFFAIKPAHAEADNPASSHLPPNCDESSDDANCKDFQIIVNKSHSQLDNFTKHDLPNITKAIKLKIMGLSKSV